VYKRQIQCSDRNGNLVAATQVTETQQLMLISDQGTLVRTRVSEVSQLSRNTQGVTLIKLPKDETLIGVVRLEAEEELEGESDIIDGDVAADMPPVESGPTGNGDEPTEA
jgi:DNA gyrase subunit A